MNKQKNVTSKQIRQALLVLFQAGYEGRGNAEHIPDAVAALAKEFGLSMYHAHMCDVYETDALDNADLHISMMQESAFFQQQ